MGIISQFCSHLGSDVCWVAWFKLIDIMVQITENISVRSLDFANQRKAYFLRHGKKLSWEDIALQVVNYQKDTPSWVTVRDTVQGFSIAKGCRKFQYAKCGRKPWKLTSDVQKYIIRRLVSCRASQIVTSVSLQADVAREKGVSVEDSTIRKFLGRRGYKWLPRSQKRKYNPEQKRVRVKFAKAVLRLSKTRLRAKLNMSMDGVVLSMPPARETERYNYCWGGVSHMWRQKTEGNLPRLAGDDDYTKQVPLSRAIPVWGGISEDGYESVLFHPTKKTNQTQWSKAVREGKLTDALRALNPRKPTGPWTILCDNESFLRAKLCMTAYRAKHVDLWSVPAKSPDLNRVEMFWDWLRKKLRVMDLADMQKKRRPMGKTAYTARVKSVMRSQKAQTVAKSIARRFRKACQQVVARKGAAADN